MKNHSININKRTVALSSVILLVVASGASYYLISQNNNKPVILDASKKADYGISVDPNMEIARERTIERQGFSIIAPAGWKEFGAPPTDGIMVQNKNEVLKDKVAADINFKVYYSVNHQALGNMDIASFKESFKSKIGKKLDKAKFSNEHKEKIDGYDSIFLEYEGIDKSKKVNFSIMTIFVPGLGQDVWLISFNTAKSNWNDDKGAFYKIAKTFKLEKIMENK
jgi:hypothetical protein